MRAVPLTKGKIAFVDDEDYELVSVCNWYAHFNKGNWYAQGRPDGVLVEMQRFLIDPGPSMTVDHIDGDGLNNCRSNLRKCTKQQNLFNKKKLRGTSRFKGVSWDKVLGKWVAGIKKDGRRQHLGVFTNEEDAARAYDKVARELFGEYARPNFGEVTDG